MAKKVFNMEGGLHSANAFTAFEARAYGSCVANATSLKVVPAGGMNVRVSIGDGIIDGQTPRRIQIDAPETIALTPASTSYARKDLIVAYIDSGVSATTSVIDNINNILKIVAVNGTPSAIPATPSDSEIQAKIGAGNQYMILAEITVARSVSSIGDSAILDRRSVITAVPAESLTGKISGSQIANQTITSDNINFATLTSQEKKIGQWLDGRAIYRKVLTVGRLPDNSTTVISHGISNLDFILGFKGYARDSAGTIIPLPFIHESASGVKITANSTSVNIGTSRDWSSFGDGHIIIEYVKK